jgi:putative NADPH-quinone reductase
MAQHIVILPGHPDRGTTHLNHALAQACADGAREAGHSVTLVDVAALDLPLPRSQAEWETQPLPAMLRPAQRAIGDAQHIVLFFPLWLGGMPALVYCWFFRAHSLKALERNILGLVGIAPIHETLVGSVENLSDAERDAWLKKLRQLGRKAA